jgi:hypothetical protein
MKKCNKCKESQSLTEYYSDTRNADGKRGICKTCYNTRTKKYSVPITDEKHRICSICKIKKKLTDYYISKRSKGGYFSYCKICSANKNKTLRSENKEYYKSYNRTYRNQPHVKIINNMRTRVHYALENETKSAKTKELLGCTILYYKKWLEYQFTEEMTWNNYGSYWHIDHVKPCISFDMSDEEEQKECFNWKNTRPMRVSDNLSKGHKVIKSVIDSHSKIVKKFLKKIKEEGSETKR